MIRAGDRLGDYQLIEEIGAGSMGRVFRARHLTGHEDLALKVLDQRLAEDPDHARRFVRESRGLREVTHPHVVGIVDVGVRSAGSFIAMPLLPGVPLSHLLEADGPPSLRTARRLLGGVASGVDAIHAAGLVHRDIKPANIMVGARGQGVLMDLGLAKRVDASLLTAPDQLVGTIGYLAPELVAGDDASPASDIYAFACTAYETIAGRPPFTGGVPDVAMAHLNASPPPLHELRADVPPSAADVLGYGLDKDPGRRPATATALIAMLRVALRERGGRTGEPAPSGQRPRTQDVRPG